MPDKCCAPNCKTNYKTGEKASCFSFPRDENSIQEWIAALKREKSFVPTKHTKVCIKHFTPDDIERETTYYDERTGRTLSAPLKYPRLRPGAVPSLLPNCPSYLTKKVKKRESVEERRRRKDKERISQAIKKGANSHEEAENHLSEVSFTNFKEFCTCLNQHPPSNSIWTIVNYVNDLMLIDIARDPIPKIKNSAIVDNKCRVSIVINDKQVKRIGDISFPFALQNMNQLHDILNKVQFISQAA